MKKVIGIGNALTDMLVNLQSDAVLTTFGIAKGSMSLVDSKLQSKISKSVAGFPYSLSLGGSADNTIRAMARLGTPVGFIGKDIDDKHRVFCNGLLYTAGRILTYAGIGLAFIPLLREGANTYALQKIIGKYGDAIVAPALILIGLFMLFGHRLNLPKFGFSGHCEKIGRHGSWGALLLGILFSLAFCPSSGVFYFGMLIPMAAAEPGGWFLPVVFAIATGMPVVIAAWILAYGAAGVGIFYGRMQIIRKWLARTVGMLFIAVGIYYWIIYFF